MIHTRKPLASTHGHPHKKRQPAAEHSYVALYKIICNLMVIDITTVSFVCKQTVVLYKNKITKYCNLGVVNINRYIHEIISPTWKIWFELAKMYTPCNRFSKDVNVTAGEIHHAHANTPHWHDQAQQAHLAPPLPSSCCLPRLFSSPLPPASPINCTIRWRRLQSHHPTAAPNINYCHRDDNEATIKSLIPSSTSRCCRRPSLAHHERRFSCGSVYLS